MRYLIAPKELELYLKRRFTRAIIVSSIIIILVLIAFVYFAFKQNDLNGLWSFVISIPLMVGATLFGIKRWNNKLLKLSGTEFILTNNSLIQKMTTGDTKEFQFSQIIAIDKMSLGSNIIKGNWITKVDYYRPKNSPYQPDSPNVIFIPNITTNYTDLISKLKQENKSTKR